MNEQMNPPWSFYRWIEIGHTVHDRCPIHEVCPNHRTQVDYDSHAIPMVSARKTLFSIKMLLANVYIQYAHPYWMLTLRHALNWTKGEKKWIIICLLCSHYSFGQKFRIGLLLWIFYIIWNELKFRDWHWKTLEILHGSKHYMELLL